MAIDRSSVLDEPVITALLRADHTGFLRVGDDAKTLRGTSEGEALQALIQLIQDEAQSVGQPVRVTVRARTGLSILLAAPDGSIEEESFVPFEDLPQPWPPPEDADAPAPVSAGKPKKSGAAKLAPAEVKNIDPDMDDDADDVELIDSEPIAAAWPAAAVSVTAASETPETADSETTESEPASISDAPSESAKPSAPLDSSEPHDEQAPIEAPVRTAPPASPAPKAPMSEQTRRDLLDAPSFLATAVVTEPAQRGFAGFVNKFGLHLAPGPSEKAERADIASVSRHFDAHRTISVINRKGGANKTPTVVNLAAVFARFGGGGVLAWDNNETMGTLGWRTEPGSHDSTVLDVLSNADDLLDAQAEFGQMSAFVHHQQADKFDVLRSDEDPSGIHEMSAAEVDVVHSIAAKYYRLIFMDSGNSDRAENWLRMLDHTDQLVVPTTTMEDRAQAALLTLQAVQSRSEKAAALARNAVVVVSEWQPKESSISQRMADDFRPYVRDVVIVPFDPALKAGRIQYDALSPATRRAWLAAAAAVAGGL